MTDLPAPLTPPECDLRDVPFPFALIEAFARIHGLTVEQVLEWARQAGMNVETRA
jgi:hypothetical protein